MLCERGRNGETVLKNLPPPWALEHDAKKWEPVFRKIMRPNKNLAQNADSDFLHFAL
jgi:hypothetical protein